MNKPPNQTLSTKAGELQFAEALALREDGPSDWYAWPGLKYFLYEYERHLCGNDDVWVAWTEVEKGAREKTIEHVLPQTPAGEWLVTFQEEERAHLTHDLGNLSLTSDNSSLGNKPFDEKKGAPGSPTPCYANSQYKMERALAQFNDWNAETLLSRREQMTTWAIGRWGVEESEGDAEIAPDDLEDDTADEIPIPAAVDIAGA